MGSLAHPEASLLLGFRGFFLLGGPPIGNSLINLSGTHGFVGPVCQAVHVMREQERFELLKRTAFNVRYATSLITDASANVRCAAFDLRKCRPTDSKDAQAEQQNAFHIFLHTRSLVREGSAPESSSGSYDYLPFAARLISSQILTHASSRSAFISANGLSREITA